MLSSKTYPNKVIMTLTNIYYAVICELPAGLQFQDAKCAALLCTEVTKCSVSNMISLQRKLIEARQQLSHSADSLVGDIDAIRQRQRHYSGSKACPQASLCYLIAAGQFKLIQSLKIMQTKW